MSNTGLARLLRTNPHVRIDYAELSAGMAAVAEARVARLGPRCAERVRFHVGGVRALRFDSASYDLIVTHFFLDCFADDDLRALVAHLAQCAVPGARWVVSEFCDAPGRWGRVWTRAVSRSLLCRVSVSNQSAGETSTRLRVDLA